MSHLVLILLIILSASAVHAQKSLEYFVRTAVNNSPEVSKNDIFRSISEIEQQRLKQDLVGTRVYMTADYLLAPYFNNRKFIDTNPEPDAIGYDAGITNGGWYSALLNVKQPLFAGKTLQANLTGVRHDQQKYEYSGSVLTHDIIRKVTDQYILVYKFQELLAMNKHLLSVIEDQEKIIRKLVESALLKRSDYILIDIERKNQIIAISRLESQKHMSLYDLFTLCGVTDNKDFTFESPEIILLPRPLEESSFLRKYRLDSLSIRDSLKVTETIYRPVVNIMGNTGLNAVSIENIQRKWGFSLGLNLTVPIYDGHQKQLYRRKTQLAENSLLKFRERKIIEVSNNRSKYIRGIQALEKNTKQLEEEKSDYQDLLAQYKGEINAGQVSVIDYIKGLRQYRQIQIDLINAQTDLLTMKNAYNYWNW